MRICQYEIEVEDSHRAGKDDIYICAATAEPSENLFDGQIARDTRQVFSERMKRDGPSGLIDN